MFNWELYFLKNIFFFLPSDREEMFDVYMKQSAGESRNTQSLHNGLFFLVACKMSELEYRASPACYLLQSELKN